MAPRRSLFSVFCLAALLPGMARSLTVVPSGHSPTAPGQASLAIVEGRPAIAWADTANNTVHYIRALDARGTAWGPRSTVTTGAILTSTTCLRVFNGRPAVCYNTNSLHISRAGDATGATWPPVAFYFSGTLRDFTVEIIAGVPALLTWDNTYLRFIRAGNADGTSWGPPVQFSPLPSASMGALAEVQGRPAVAFSPATESGLWFMLAQDASGSTWGNPRLAATTPSATAISMQIAGGAPAISYTSFESGVPTLKYVRATTADGTAWGAPVTLTSTLPVVPPFPPAQPLKSSLAVIKGKPAVAFFPGTASDLRYREAIDSFGTVIESWNPTATLDNGSAGAAAAPPALLEVNGSPAVAYIDPSNSSLIYLRATDASGGTLWPPDIRVHSSAGSLIPDSGTATFGGVRIGESATLRMTVTNPESAADTLTITGLTIDGPHAAEFSIVTPPDTSLPGGGTSEFVVRHSPLTPGSKSATLHLTSNSEFPANPHDITLTANSVADISVNPAGAPTLPDGGTARYSLTAPGALSTLVFHITNPGGAPLTGLSVSIDGANSSEFAVTAAPAPSLAPGAGTTFTVRHAPLTAGIKTAALHILNNLLLTRNPFDIFLVMLPGALDASFAPPPGGQPFFSVAVEPGGRILAGGSSLITAFRQDGRADTSFFSPAINAGGRVTSIAVQRDGGILMGGSFTTVGGFSRPGLARLFPDGSVDPSFDAGITPNAQGVSCIGIQPDGKILAGGYFEQVAGATHRYLVRLTPDGSVDPSFQAPALNDAVYALSLLPDGRSLAAGHFTSLHSGSPFLARFNSNGSADPFSYRIFTPVIGIGWRPDGVLLAAESDGGLLRMEPDGTATIISIPPHILDLAMQVNGECLAGGDLVSPLPVVLPRLFRVDVNGTANSSGADQPNAAVRKLALQADGKLLIAGDFNSMGSIARPGLARLTNDGAFDELTRQGSTSLHWMRSGSAPDVSDVSFEMNSPGDSSWTLLGWGTRIPGGWELTGLTLPASCQIRARGRAGGSLMQTVATFLTPLEAWLLQHFKTAANTGDAANHADPDHDGLTNIVEFAFGTSPVNPADSTLPEFKLTGGAWTATFTAPAGREQVTYAAEWSPAMLPGTWTEIPDTGTAPAHTFTAPPGLVRAFVRFLVSVK